VAGCGIGVMTVLPGADAGQFAASSLCRTSWPHARQTLRRP
jgi:hypothetical protein